MVTNDYIEPLIQRLTYNAAVTLRNTVERPSPHGDYLGGDQRIFTGLGKWTTIAAGGVANCCVANGLAEERPYRPNGALYTYITPLGKEVARYLSDHWDDVKGKLRHPERRG
jgi:hypothetical protein